ncbi:hypothetical protein MMC14_007404 [Varicellaria rhodocarpa]|nr:hypothetical protein [Varicellaria rhodocarpa]
MRCNNQGSDYEDGSIQWTCTASLPEEFKLGSTDVICEGYDSSTDPYILKGSCGVEYRLILTSKGEAKYGQEKASANDNDGSNTSANANGVTLIFWIIFLGVVVWILYAACTRDNPGRLRRGPDHNTFGWGGGGGGPDGDDDDPPPPYDADLKPSTSRSGANHTTQGWRPGFWSGAAAGATGTAAGFLARNHHESRVSGSSRPTPDSNSRTRSSGSGSSFSSARHESTSFGSTSRR